MRSAWQSISGYVRGIMEAAHLNATLALERDHFTVKNDRFLMPAFRDAWNQILGFRKSYDVSLPDSIRRLIDSYENTLVKLVFNAPATPDGLLEIVTAVCTVRSRIDFLLSG